MLNSIYVPDNVGTFCTVVRLEEGLPIICGRPGVFHVLYLIADDQQRSFITCDMNHQVADSIGMPLYQFHHIVPECGSSSGQWRIDRCVPVDNETSD